MNFSDLLYQGLLPLDVGRPERIRDHGFDDIYTAIY
jgi:hypothetical protein